MGTGCPYKETLSKKAQALKLAIAFLQRVSIACYAKRCTSYRILSHRLTVLPSVTVGIMPK